MLLVAPSFQNFTKVSEPYLKNNKQYVKMQNPKTGTTREVRVYSEKEYSRLYGIKLEPTQNNTFKNLKHTRGFDNGYITVIRNNSNEDEEWLRKSSARYAVGIKWYFVSTEPIPEDIPPHFKCIILTWDEFKDQTEDRMKTPEQLEAIIKQKEEEL